MQVHETAVAVTETRYGSLSYLREDDPIGLSVRVYGEWAQLELEFLLQFVPLGATVVDAGANIGTHALAFARAVGGDGRVLAFEPQAAIFDLLTGNVAANRLTNVEARCAALGDARGVRYVPALDYTSHLNAGAVALSAIPSAQAVAVDTISLDELELPAVSLIKVDVEGMEGEVLRGAVTTLGRYRPFIFVECNTVVGGAEVLRSIAGADYAVYYKRSPAYNPRNARGEPRNVFGVAREAGLFCVPREGEAEARAVLDTASELFRVESIDELAAEVLRTPRYGDRTEHDRDADWLRRALAHAHGDTPNAVSADERTRISLETSLDPQATALARLRYRVVKQAHALDVYDEDLRALRARLAQTETALQQALADNREQRSAAKELAARFEHASADARRVWSEAELMKRRLGGAVAALRTELDAARARNDELSAANREALGAAEDAVADLTKRRTELQAAVDGLRADLAARDEALASMQRTVSWRITRPLRAIRRMLRGEP